MYVGERASQRSQLMNDHFRLYLGNRTGNPFGIQCIGNHRPRSETANSLNPRITSRHPSDVVTTSDEPRDELLPQRPRGPCDQDLHDDSFISSC
jgi:hypothetical protein